MGILFHTSFDHYTTMSDRWTSVGSPAPTIGAVGRNGTNGAILDTTNNRFARHTLESNQSTIYVALGYQITALPSSGAATFFELLDNGTRQIAIAVRADGKLEFFRNITQVGPLSASVISAGVYYHIEFKVVFDSSSGSIDLRVNEVADTNFPGTSLNTIATANAYITQVGLWCDTFAPSAGIHHIDDLIVRNDTWSGDLQVGVFFPTGVGSTNSWAVTGASSSWQATDESAPNSDTDYISTSTVGDQTLFTTDSLPTSSIIHAVTPIPWVEKTDAGSAQFASLLRISSTTYTGATQAPSDVSYTYFPDINTTSPATGVTWTVAEWNSIEFGVTRTV